MNERQDKILEYIIQNKQVNVADLSKLFKVSQVTIRKDLDLLEESSLIKREHGYAVLNESDDINIRLATNYKQKEAIAKEAAKLVEDGELIFIESGSCCALLAREIAQTKKNIILITNSVFIADFIKNYDSVKVILTGGSYQKESGVLTGDLAQKSFGQFHSDKCFIGIDGYLPGEGFFGSDIDRGQVVKEMINFADNVYILTDSTKFKRSAPVKLLEPNRNIKVITDNAISSSSLESLNKDHIEPVIANV